MRRRWRAPRATTLVAGWSRNNLGDQPRPLPIAGEQVAVHTPQPLEVMDVIVEVGHQQQRLAVQLAPKACDVALIAPREHVIVVEIQRNRPGELRAELLGESRVKLVRLAAGKDVVMDSVYDHAGEWNSNLLEHAP